MYIHSKMEQPLRNSVFHDFRAGNSRILVCSGTTVQLKKNVTLRVSFMCYLVSRNATLMTTFLFFLTVHNVDQKTSSTDLSSMLMTTKLTQKMQQNFQDVYFCFEFILTIFCIFLGLIKLPWLR